MTAPMIDFSLALLQGLALFLSSEPGLQLFSVILLCFICKAVKLLVSH